MTNKRKYAVTAAFLAALMLGTAACKQDNKPGSATETTTTAAAATEAVTTTTAAPETTTTTSAPETTTETEAPAKETDFEIKTGVWLAQSEYEGDSYYTFREDGSGNVLSQEMGIGVPFGYTHDGVDYTFEMAAVDNFVKMTVTDATEDRIKIKWEYGLEETLTYLGPAEGFSFYNTDELKDMAAYRFMQDNGGYAMFTKYGEVQQSDGLVKLSLYDCSRDDKGLIGCYTVDRYTGKGTDINGSEIELARFEGETYEPFFWQKTGMSMSGSMLGVRYIGYVDPESNDARINDVYFNDLFYKTGLCYECNYYWNAETTRFVPTKDGQEFYFVIPYDSNATVVVKEMKMDDATATLVEGDEIYHSENDGEPFLLKCNVSEIMPDVKVIVTDSQGNTLEWLPGISGKDGSVVTSAEGGKVQDFTNYGALATVDMAPVG